MSFRLHLTFREHIKNMAARKGHNHVLTPIVSYYLSCWYKRQEFGIRQAIFFSAAALAGSFGGLLAAAIALMDGIGGKQGWAWIFILEGLATVFIGVISYWMVHDFPDEAKFLSEEDRQRVICRLKEDKQSSAKHENFKMDYFWASVKDWKTWAYAVIYMGCDGPLYAFSLFLPTIIENLGYESSTTANLLSVPPYACAAILTVFIGWLADRTKARGYCVSKPMSRTFGFEPRHHVEYTCRMFETCADPCPSLLEHRCFHHRDSRILHAHRECYPWSSVRRHLPGRSWDIPMHSQQHILGSEQRGGGL